MLKRKIEEIGSSVYRSLFYPFVRINLEVKTKSIMKQGSYMNKGSKLMGRNYIGKNTHLSNVTVGFGSYINNNCDFTNTEIGKYTSIGANVSTILGSHPLDGCHVALHPAFYSKSEELGFSYADFYDYEEQAFLDTEKRVQVKIGNDVWIGNNCLILEGVTIGDGAVIGAGSVVNSDVKSYGVYAGVPAKKIKMRFAPQMIEGLEKIKWWERDEDWIKKNVRNKAFSQVEQLVSQEKLR